MSMVEKEYFELPDDEPTTYKDIDIIGNVKLWLRDLEKAWEKENGSTIIEVTRADAYLTLEFDIAAPSRVK